MSIRLMRQRAAAFQQSLQTMSALCPWKPWGGSGSMSPWDGGAAEDSADDITGATPAGLKSAESSLDLIGELFDTLTASHNKTRIKGYAAQIKLNAEVMLEQIADYVKELDKKKRA